MPSGTFTLTIELGNAGMASPQDVADALARVAAEVGETGRWEDLIRDENGNTVGRYLLSD